MLKIGLLILCLQLLVDAYYVTTSISTIVVPNSNNNAIVAIMVPIVLVAILLIILAIVCYYFHNNAGYAPLEWEDTDGPPSGLCNTNETCYMNSMIQALASSEKLIDEFDQLILKCTTQDESYRLKLFVNLLKNINCPKNRQKCVQVNTRILQRVVKDANWTKESQQDAFQLLSAVINSIQRSCSKTLRQEEMTMPPKLKLLHSFSESPSYNKVQDHLALSVPLCGNFRVRPGVQLNDLIDAFFSPSQIDDGSNSTKISFFKEVPDVLLIHIQANEYIANAYVKPEYYIDYDEIMKYKCHVHMKIDGSDIKTMMVEYKLTAVVRHTGDVSGGHYITYRKNGCNWYLTNDTKVEVMVFTRDIIPYIMIYEKIFAEILDE